MAKFPRAPLSYEKLKELEVLLTDFVDSEEVSCSEAVYQRDDIAEKMPDLLEALFERVGYHRGPGDFDGLEEIDLVGASKAVPYVMRSNHGSVLAGTKASVWRTENGMIKARVFVRDVIERLGASSPRFLGKGLLDTIIFDYASAWHWHIEGVEQPREGSKPL